MLRSSPFWITLLSLGSITSVLAVSAARAADPARTEDPPCPTQALGSVSIPTPAPGKPLGKINVTSDQATLGVDGNATLQGNVEVREGDREIRANQVEYDRKKKSIKTEGGIDYSDPVVHVTGEGGSYSPDTGADFKSAQFELRQRAARGSAQTMNLTPEGVMQLKGVTFTTCPADAQAWLLRADDITINTQTKIGSGHAARLDFEGVPLMYLPWVSFPLSSQRKSGFLFPTIGTTSRSGVELATPYYFNIAPNVDFTFQPIEYSRRNIDLGGDLRFLTESQHGSLDWDYLPDDTAYGSYRSRVRLRDVAELPDAFRFTVNAETVSDTQYFEDFSQGPEGTSTAFVQQHAILSYRDDHWRIDGEAQHYQTIDYTLLPMDRPYARVPRLAASADYGWGPDQVVRYGFDSEVVNFDRATGVTGWRVDASPGASLDFERPGYFARPALAWRVTQYELSNLQTPVVKRSPSRTLPIASFDTGLVFERPSGSRDQRRLTLEPRLLYLYVPYRNQNNLPFFDTELPDLINTVMLFRTNRYVGADRQGDADQVSVGVTSRLLDAHSGRQFLAGTFGQIYYFETPRVVIPGEIPRTDKRSDFVAQLALTAFQNWGADLGLQWDPQTSRSQRSYVNLQYKPAGDRVVNLGYRFERGSIEQAEISGAWPISRSWNVFVRDVYSLRDHQALEQFAGFEYRACCWRLRFGGRHFVSGRPNPPATTGSTSTGLWLQLELAGLASVGSASDASLREDIRGYVPPNPSSQNSRTQ
jgi:LPS-assembly protein